MGDDLHEVAKARVRELARAQATEGVGAAERLMTAIGKLWDDNEDELAIAMYDELQLMGAQRAIAMARLEVKAAPKKGHFVEPIKARGEIMTWELPNGAMLGMANVADLEDAIAKHQVKARAHIGWVKFYGDVRARLLKAKVYSVGDLFAAPELLKLAPPEEQVAVVAAEEQGSARSGEGTGSPHG